MATMPLHSSSDFGASRFDLGQSAYLACAS
jgi:hypothetical protein